MKKITLVALIALSSGCSHENPQHIGTIIDKDGKHIINSNYVSELEIGFDDTGKKLLWFGSDDSPSAIADSEGLFPGWFVFVETPSRFWVYNGGEKLELIVYTEPEASQIVGVPYKREEVPTQVLERLPENIKQLPASG